MSLKNVGLSQHSLIRDLEFVCQLHFEFFPPKIMPCYICSRVSDGFASLSVTSKTIPISYQVGPELVVAAFPPLTFPSSPSATLKQAFAFSLYIAVLSFQILLPQILACFTSLLLFLKSDHSHRYFIHLWSHFYETFFNNPEKCFSLFFSKLTSFLLNGRPKQMYLNLKVSMRQ